MGKANRFGSVAIAGIVVVGALFIARSSGISGHATGDADAEAGCGGESTYSYPGMEEEDANANGNQDNAANREDETVADFATEFAEAACALYEECDELAGMGGGVERCVRSVEDAYIEMDQEGDCDFDVEAAEHCLDELDGMECDEIGDDVDRDSACFQVCGEVPVWTIF